MNTLPVKCDCQACSQRETHPCGVCRTRLTDLGVTKGSLEILKGINLEIHCGELTALIGPNGAGKSTLLKAILGEVRHSGTLSFLSGDGSQTRPPRLGYVPQKLDLDAGSPTSVWDLITAAHTVWPVWLVKTQASYRHARKVLSRVEAEHLVDRQLGALSGGELQRVLLALALDPVPQLLLLDEPVSGIDPKGLELFYTLVANLRRQYDLSIILVSHDLESVAHHADRIVLLNQSVISCGTPEEVFSHADLIDYLGEGARRHRSLV